MDGLNSRACFNDAFFFMRPRIFISIFIHLLVCPSLVPKVCPKVRNAKYSRRDFGSYLFNFLSLYIIISEKNASIGHLMALFSSLPLCFLICTNSSFEKKKVKFAKERKKKGSFPSMSIWSLYTQLEDLSHSGGSFKANVYPFGIYKANLYLTLLWNEQTQKSPTLNIYFSLSLSLYEWNSCPIWSNTNEHWELREF